MPTFISNVQSEGDIVAQSNSSSKTVRVSNITTTDDVYVTDSIQQSKKILKRKKKPPKSANTSDTLQILFKCFVILVLFFTIMAFVRWFERS